MVVSLSLVAVACSIFPIVTAQVFSNSNGGVYTVTQGTGGDIPLISKHFQWPYLPYKVDTGDGSRGTQQGYNICNSTTENQQSMCVTAFINSISDFCVWGSDKADNTGSGKTVGDLEGEMVAYCTKKGHGTRLIAGGALQGVQFMRTPAYIQVVGAIDQTALAFPADDTGGEEDSIAADGRGNPIGALLYSNAFGNETSVGKDGYVQIIYWSFFIGSGTFCFKACDPAGANAASLCEHRYDRMGCNYNAPANYAAINGTFTSCKGENQLPAGVYVQNGATLTFAQPGEPTPITSIPYVAAIPASSDCTTYTSASLYTELSLPSSSASASSAGAGKTTAPPTSAPTSSASSTTAPQSGSANSNVLTGCSIFVATVLASLMAALA